jgi:hypothetical protein
MAQTFKVFGSFNSPTNFLPVQFVFANLCGSAFFTAESAKPSQRNAKDLRVSKVGKGGLFPLVIIQAHRK